MTISKPYVAAAYRTKLRLLAETGRFEVGLICPPAWGAQKFEPDATPPPYWLRQLPIVLNGRNHFHVYEGLAAAVKEFRPDVLNVEEEHYSLVTGQAFQIARSLGVPALFYTWQNILKRYPPPFSWLETWIFKVAAGGVCGNREAMDVLRAKGYRGPLWEIPQMGVDVERFAPADSSPAARAARKRALGLDDGAFWIGFFGRLVEEKGVQDLLAALAQLPENARALIVGGGPYADALVRKARELGVADRARFVATVPSGEVAAWLQAVDALCLPSLTRPNWKEQFGRVLVEAMAAEAVVVGSSSGEIPRVIGDAGLVHQEGDPAALAAALKKAIADPALADGLRRTAAARVRERYTNAIVADRFGAALEIAATNNPK